MYGNHPDGAAPAKGILLAASHGGKRLHTGLDGRVRSLRVRVVLAHEVLHINHQRLDVRTDGFLICLKGLDCDIPLVFAPKYNLYPCLGKLIRAVP